jgi:DNA-binding GntR family transcriptional regulator
VSELGTALEERLTLRHVLETGAAEAAARRLSSPEQRDHLMRRLAETTAAQPADYRRLDSRLHLAIAEVAGVPTLTGLIADIRMHMNELLDGIPLLDVNIDHSNDQHADIIAAITEGDPPRARRLMAEHLAGSAALLRGFLTP